jgi:Flp pilus assembly pilin Flp
MTAIVNDAVSRRARLLARLFFADTAAATSIEYALIAGLVSITILTGGLSIREQLTSVFTSLLAGFP